MKKLSPFFIYMIILIFSSIAVKASELSPPQITIDFEPFADEQGLRDEVYRLISRFSDNIFPGSSFSITSERKAENWILLSIASLDGPDCSQSAVGAGNCLNFIIGSKDDEGNWLVSLGGTSEYQEMLNRAPTSLVSLNIKPFLHPLNQQYSEVQILETNTTFKFPFVGAWAYWWGRGMRNGKYHDALDIGTYSVELDTGTYFDRRVLSAAPGVVSDICEKGTVTANVTIAHEGGITLQYFHLEKNSLNVKKGQQVWAGTLLGEVKNGNFDYDGCGVAYQWNTSAHLHWITPRNTSFTVDGWTIVDPNQAWKKGSETRSPSGGLNEEHLPSTNQIPVCPKDSDAIILYKDANYSCGGDPNGYVRVYLQDGYYASLPSNFGASSIRIPDGWYVELTPRNASGVMPARRFAPGDESFLLDRFYSNKMTLPVNDMVAAVRVRRNENNFCPSNGLNSISSCLPNSSPQTPVLASPSNGYVSMNFRSPTLCWNQTFDPEGDEIEYLVEIVGRSINSGWTKNTCWRPSQLDYNYNWYQWRVKVRDIPARSESLWSETRSFNIAAPNRPPNISFDTANGSAANLIYSRDRDWVFLGTASDPENQLNRVEYRCSGDNCGYADSHSGASNWTYSQKNLAGRNDIYFIAYDNAGYYGQSRHLDLRIDLAKPSTQISFNGNTLPSRWPAWFTHDVEVQISATDNGTGRAISGIQQLNYRINNGGWQTVNNNSASFLISADGTHTIEYYAVDKVGNIENAKSTTFKIDQTPPSLPDGTMESSRVSDNQWQKDQNMPTFTWAESSDATSGLWGYQLYFGKDSSGIGYQNFQVGIPREWTPHLNGVHTGTYYLRGRSRDIAGNWSAWTTMFTFRYDGTLPENPVDIAHSAEITSTIWQRDTNIADFIWSVPHDEGSGIQGYYIYWGLNPTFTTTQLITNNMFQDFTPLCGYTEACIGYLRLRSVDNVGNLATEWSTLFELRYDNAPPVVDFTINNGITETVQTQLFLDINASDQGSGVRSMRVSNDGKQWIPWEAYALQRTWMIPPISRQTWPVYVQVNDWVDLSSDVVSNTIRLDVNRKQSQSENFRLFDQNQPAGAGAFASTTYTGRGTLGQTVQGDVTASNNFILWNNYEASNQAIPILQPGHDDFNYINSVFSSGDSPMWTISSSFSMLGTFGEWGLPHNTSTIVSGNFQHQPGFLAAQPPSLDSLIDNIPGPEPEPVPELSCKTPKITINQDASFINQLHVNLNICAPQAVEMMLGNDAAFTDSNWEPFAETKEWVLINGSQQVVPVYIYIAFKDANGTIDKTYFDDVLYDPNIPTSELMVGDSLLGLETTQFTQANLNSEGPQSMIMMEGIPFVQTDMESGVSRFVPMLTPNESGGVDILVNSYDDNSGVAQMQISTNPAFTDTTWTDFNPLVLWMPPGEDGLKTVYVRLSDSAGNISSLSETSFIYDANPPVGWVSFSQRVYPTDTFTTTVFLNANDGITWEAYDGEFDTPPDSYAGIVSEMRFSFNSALNSVPWQAYTDTLDIQLPESDSGTIYVQYRDLAGNISEVYSDTYQIDVMPPIFFIEVSSGETLSRTLTLSAYDDLSGISEIRLRNDPWDEEFAVIMPFSESIAWTFNEDRIVWVQVSDSVGNWSDSYPAYAERIKDDRYYIYLPLIQK